MLVRQTTLSHHHALPHINHHRALDDSTATMKITISVMYCTPTPYGAKAKLRLRLENRTIGGPAWGLSSMSTKY